MNKCKIILIGFEVVAFFLIKQVAANAQAITCLNGNCPYSGSSSNNIGPQDENVPNNAMTVITPTGAPQSVPTNQINVSSPDTSFGNDQAGVVTSQPTASPISPPNQATPLTDSNSQSYVPISVDAGSYNPPTAPPALAAPAAAAQQQSATSPGSGGGAAGGKPAPTAQNPAPAAPAAGAAQPAPAAAAAQPQATSTTDPTDPQYVKNAENDVQACKKAHTTAQNCCANPASCLGGSQSVSQAVSLISAAISAGGVIALGSANGNTAQLQSACNVLQYVGYGSMAINGSEAGACLSNQSACQSACDQVKATYQPTVDANPPSSNRTKLETQISIAVSTSNSCQNLNSNISQDINRTVEGGLGSQFAGLCANLALANQNALANQPVFNGDCSNPMNAGNPACLSCTGTNSSNPLCVKGASLGDGAASGVGVTNKANFGNGSATAANVSNLPGFDGNAQVPNFQDNKAANATSTGVPGGGAGGSLLNSGNNSGFGQPAERGQGRGMGYNTDVLQGTSGGSGYTVSPGAPAVATNGFSGYGSPDDKKAAKGFDLRQYLPGGAKDPKRQIAGLGAPRAEMGNRFDDIFKRVNDRVQILCKLDRLMECNSHKK